ncbi:MAG: molybdopterin-dependent oxidoreductase, partial [Blastocatellia bacterium]
MPLVKGRDGVQAPASWEQAIQSAHSGLKSSRDAGGADSIIGLGSAMATNEALFLFRKYISEQIGPANFEFRLDHEDQKVTEREDQLLRRMDKHANSTGAVKLGLLSEKFGGIDGLIKAAGEGKLKAGVLIYLRPLVSRPGDVDLEAKVAELVKKLEYSVVLAAEKTDWLADSNVVLPVANWSEEEGTYTNFQGRVQFAGQAISPGDDILPVWQVMSMLLEAGGTSTVWTSPAEVFSTLAKEVGAFKSLSYEETRLPG